MADTNLLEKVQANNTKLQALITELQSKPNVTLETATVTPSTSSQTLTPTKYGFSEVFVEGVELSLETVTPTTTSQIITPSHGIGMGEVHIEAVDESIDANIQPENIVSGVSILGVAGTAQTDRLNKLLKNQLTSLTADDFSGVTSIERYQFYTKTALTSVEIPEGVVSVGENAFFSCLGLLSIKIPSTLLNLYNNAFISCTNLNRVDIVDLGAWCNITLASMFSNPLYYAHNLYLNNELVTSLIIPNSTTTIKIYSFAGCTSLTSLLTNNVVTIQQQAFHGCSNLSNVTLGSALTSIAINAFENCSSLTEMTILATTPPTLDNANAISSATTTIYVPQGTKTTYESATNWASLTTRATNPVTFVELGVVNRVDEDISVESLANAPVQDGDNLTLQ